MDLDDRHRLPTPEGITLDVVVAGLGSRFIAFFIDNIIIAAISYVITVVFQAIAGPIIVSGQASPDTIPGSGQATASDEIVGVLLAIYLVIQAVLYIGYFVVTELTDRGRSVGKRVTGLRVVRVDGRPENFRTSLVRNLFRLVDILPFSYAVGAASIFLSTKHQRLGDFAAGTIVVRERTGDKRPLAMLPWATPVHWTGVAGYAARPAPLPAAPGTAPYGQGAVPAPVPAPWGTAPYGQGAVPPPVSAPVPPPVSAPVPPPVSAPVPAPWGTAPYGPTPVPHAGGPPQAMWRLPLPPYLAHWDVTGVSEDEMSAVRTFLERRWGLDAEPRSEAGMRLARLIWPNVSGPTTPIGAEQFLEAVSLAKAARG